MSRGRRGPPIAPDGRRAAALVGGVEAGGTKFVCAVGAGPDDLRARVVLPTTTPAETLAAVIAFFRAQSARLGGLAAIGIGSFGPLGLNPAETDFGHITSTPKPGWQNVDLAGAIGRALQLPVALDTDVNAAALGEHRWGAAQGLDSFVYLTVGTGIGGGVMAEGRLLHGLVHPEIGHMRLPHDRQADPFAGACIFHGDCLEGLASGHALAQRWNAPAQLLPPAHPAWRLEAHYLALGLANLVCTLSPQRLLLGGGVMRQRHLLPMIRQAMLAHLNGYVRASSLLERVEEYVQAPQLGENAGVAGGLALALALDRRGRG